MTGILKSIAALTLASAMLFAGLAPATAQEPGRVKIMSELADPDITFDGTRYILTGTNERTRGKTLRFWQSRDLTKFTELVEYNPSKVDKKANYCRIWAPDVYATSSKYVVTFSATKYPEGGSCPCLNCDASDRGVTTYRAEAPRDTFAVRQATADQPEHRPAPVAHHPRLPGAGLRSRDPHRFIDLPRAGPRLVSLHLVSERQQGRRFPGGRARPGAHAPAPVPGTRQRLRQRDLRGRDQ